MGGLLLTHNLAGGVVVVKDNKVLLIKDKNGWSLPKGSTEFGETFLTTAKREGFEETGYHLNIEDVAFITEYTTKEYGQYLQVYYSGEIISKMDTQDPDQDVIEIKFIPSDKIREFLKFRPWVIPLENWLKERDLKYYCFDLDKEGFEI